MYALTMQGGMCTSTPPDTCKTPSPTGPVPMPYVNIFQCNQVTPSTACSKVTICGSAALTIKSTTTISNGNEPGTLGGVASGKFICQGAFASGSSQVTL